MRVHSALTRAEVDRYGRQLLVEGFGVEGQLALAGATVLVVGAGGLGCPVALYLAGAGVGRLLVVDDDVVERSNLHRQIAHRESACGASKARSLCAAVAALNTSVVAEPIEERFTAANARALVRRCTVAVDASDNVGTRYLLNDTCVAEHRPLVSGSALRFEGHVTTYHGMAGGGVRGPCYRCLYPVPPPAETVTNCADGGVLGPGQLCGHMLVFDGELMRVRGVRLRARRVDCASCGDGVPAMQEAVGAAAAAAAAAASCTGGDTQACMPCSDADVPAAASSPGEDEVGVRDFVELLAAAERGTHNGAVHIVDVRPAHVFRLFHLSGALNAPIEELGEHESRIAALEAGTAVLVCRRGVSSMDALRVLRADTSGRFAHLRFVNLHGGMRAYATHVDDSVPYL